MSIFVTTLLGAASGVAFVILLRALYAWRFWSRR